MARVHEEADAVLPDQREDDEYPRAALRGSARRAREDPEVDLDMG
jgi:hypothetical protein